MRTSGNLYGKAIGIVCQSTAAALGGREIFNMKVTPYQWDAQGSENRIVSRADENLYGKPLVSICNQQWLS